MAINGSQLGQLRPANTTAASIYSPASSIEAQITAIMICNTGGVAVKFRLFHDDDGTTYDETSALFWDISLIADETVTLTFEKGIYMDVSTGNFAVRTSVANALTFTIYGLEK